MDNQRTNEQELLIPKNTFSEEERRDIIETAAALGVSPPDLLADAWRSYIDTLMIEQGLKK